MKPSNELVHPPNTACVKYNSNDEKFMLTKLSKQTHMYITVSLFKIQFSYDYWCPAYILGLICDKKAKT